MSCPGKDWISPSSADRNALPERNEGSTSKSLRPQQSPRRSGRIADQRKRQHQDSSTQTTDDVTHFGGGRASDNDSNLDIDAPAQRPTTAPASTPTSRDRDELLSKAKKPNQQSAPKSVTQSFNAVQKKKQAVIASAPPRYQSQHSAYSHHSSEATALDQTSSTQRHDQLRSTRSPDSRQSEPYITMKPPQDPRYGMDTNFQGISSLPAYGFESNEPYNQHTRHEDSRTPHGSLLAPQSGQHQKASELLHSTQYQPAQPVVPAYNQPEERANDGGSGKTAPLYPYLPPLAPPFPSMLPPSAPPLPSMLPPPASAHESTSIGPPFAPPPLSSMFPSSIPLPSMLPPPRSGYQHGENSLTAATAEQVGRQNESYYPGPLDNAPSTAPVPQAKVDDDPE